MPRWLSKDDILGLPEDVFPLAVLSFNYRSFISTGINIRKNSHYNHFMWAHKPGLVASQGIFFREEKITAYLDHHRLKFWHNPHWTTSDKGILKEAIQRDLDKPKYKTRYDFIAILGQLLGKTGIQVPWTRICSDYADYLKKLDSNYDLQHPAPNDVNNWFATRPDYAVYGRYVKD